jgi:hypothetical protein
MSIPKCDVCGCPRPGGYRLHYKTCSVADEYNRKYDEDLKVMIKGEIQTLESQIRYYKKETIEDTKLLGEWRDCLKNTCLDEVYLCRIDGPTAPGKAWLN